MNVLPCPGVLTSLISPPSSVASSRLIARPEAGAAVLAAGAGVGLLERLEDQPLLLRRDADAGVGDLDGDGALARTAAPDDRATSRSVTGCTRIVDLALRR